MQSVDIDASFVYNENGLRVQKTVNGVVTNYTLHGKNVVHMTQSNDELHFFYDAQNKPAVVVLNGTPYSYVKNLQGDIVAILDGNGTAVVQYKYDAWGRQIDCTFEAGNDEAEALSTLNPFRYRGYVYDEETRLYYLRNRYIDVHTCRFLNADIITEKNCYEYCNNRPVHLVDLDGFEPTSTLDVDGDNIVDYYVYSYNASYASSATGIACPTDMVAAGSGNVYISVGTEKPIPPQFDRSWDVLVVDYTINSNNSMDFNASMKMLQAQHVQSWQRAPILKCLIQYAQDFNRAEWDRTDDLDGLLVEWDAHIMLGYHPDAIDVDFDDREKDCGYSYFMKKAWNRGWGYVGNWFSNRWDDVVDLFH